jgi:hypothetical protein
MLPTLWTSTGWYGSLAAQQSTWCAAQEENGATGNKGLAGLLGNPVLSTSVAGLATAATGFAAVEVGACTT